MSLRATRAIDVDRISDMKRPSTLILRGIKPARYRINRASLGA
jgi:hypothetical protein